MDVDGQVVIFKYDTKKSYGSAWACDYPENKPGDIISHEWKKNKFAKATVLAICESQLAATGIRNIFVAFKLIKEHLLS